MDKKELIVKFMNDIILKWRNKEIKVRLLEDFPEVYLLTTKLGPYKRNEEVRLKYWIAKILKNNKIVEYSEDVEYTVEELLKVLWSEQEKSKILEIDKEFYLRTKETLSDLLNKIVNKDNISLNTQLLQKKEKMQTLFNDIFSRRLYKILRIASKSSNQSQFLNDLTEEELLLFNELRDIINQWKKDFIEINYEKS
ncbi:MAG: hypothetical protein GF329_10230 [Candidatus Lokiarchaeota archaeon]|nr:hypothetical protein [Candidatus Lokiarchaeota archaeon]